MKLYRAKRRRQAYMKEYRARHRVKLRERKKEWVKRNRAKVAAFQRAWVARDPEGIRAYMAAWRRNHPWAVMSSRLKALKPGDSLFPTFCSLDVLPDYEETVMVERQTPLSILMEREAA